MRVCYVLCAVLAVLLLASNVWWGYQAMDAASVSKYREQMLFESAEALQQAMALLPRVAGQTSRQDIVQEAEVVARTEAFEKEGRVWVGWLGFRFEEGGELDSVVTDFELPKEYEP